MREDVLIGFLFSYSSSSFFNWLISLFFMLAVLFLGAGRVFCFLKMDVGLLCIFLLIASHYFRIFFLKIDLLFSGDLYLGDKYGLSMSYISSGLFCCCYPSSYYISNYSGSSPSEIAGLKVFYLQKLDSYTPEPNLW